MYKKIVLPAGLLAGTIIGAGVFALPYLFFKAGILTGLFYLAIFGFVFVLIHLLYADVILRTTGDYRFAGYSEIYLGAIGRWLALIVTILGMVLVLTVYLVLSISFLNLILPANPLVKLFLFWLPASLAVFWSVKRVAFSEFLLAGAITAIIFLIFIYGLGNFGQISPLPIFNLGNILLPYGAVLFSLSGRVAIPVIIDYFQKDKRRTNEIKKSISLGTLAPVIMYFLFIVGVWGLSGTISPDAVSGIKDSLPRSILWFLGGLGAISLWSTYIVIGQDVRKSLEYDFKFSKFWAGAAIIFAPLFLYLAGLQNFLQLVGLVGGVFIGIESILIILIWRKSLKLNPEKIIFKNLPAFIIYALFIIFILGIIVEIEIRN